MTRHDEDTGVACLTIALILVVNVVWIGALVWLIVACVQWLGRH